MAAGNGAERSNRITPRFGPVASLRCAPGCHSSHTCYRPDEQRTEECSSLDWSEILGTISHWSVLEIVPDGGGRGIPCFQSLFRQLCQEQDKNVTPSLPRRKKPSRRFAERRKIRLSLMVNCLARCLSITRMLNFFENSPAVRGKFSAGAKAVVVPSANTPSPPPSNAPDSWPFCPTRPTK